MGPTPPLAKGPHPLTTGQALALDTPDTTRVLRLMWQRKWHILACAFFIGLAAFVLSARQPEKFTAQTTVLLDPRKSNIVVAADQIVSDLEFTSAAVESEIARIGSEASIQKVVRNLGYNHLKVLDPGPRKYTGMFGIVDSAKGLLRPAKSDQFDLVSPKERALLRVVYEVANGTHAQRVGQSFVINLQVTTVDAVLSAEIANRLTQLYITRQIQERRDIALQATLWHEEQVSVRRAVMERAEKQVEDLRRQHLATSGGTSEILKLQLAELARALAEASADHSGAKSQLATLRADIADNGPRAVAETQGTDVFLRLLDAEEDLKSDAQKLAAKYGANHVERQANAYQLKRQSDRIGDAVSNLLNAQENRISLLRARELALQKDVESLQAQIVDAGAATRQLRQVEIEANSAKENYEHLVSRLADIRAQANLQISDARILSAAQVPTGPSAPRPKFMGFFGASIGASLGVLSVLIFEAMGRGVSTREDLQAVSGVPTISVLPRGKLDRTTGILALLASRAYVPLAEKLRQLQTVMAFQSLSQSQVILVTSSLPKEGCSTVAVALSQLNAEAGKKTLLLCAEGGAGLQFGEHRSDLDKEPLKKWVQGGGCRFTRPSNAHFECLVWGDSMAGKKDTELLQSLHELRENYDVIVIDGPPLLAWSDGLKLAQHVDHLAYVVAFQKTPKRSIISGLSLLNSVGVRPSILILNRSDPRLDPDVHVRAA